MILNLRGDQVSNIDEALKDYRKKPLDFNSRGLILSDGWIEAIQDPLQNA